MSMEEFDGDFTKPTIFVQNSGKIISYADYKFVLGCKMNLDLYPIDIQSCNLTILTFTISKSRLQFAPDKFDLKFRPELFEDLTYDPVYIGCSSNPRNGRRDPVLSNLVLQFVFKRRIDLYLMTTYFPSLLATIVSFTSFWIQPDAVPGRVTLGVTCLLALMTQMVSVRNAISNTNYVTSIDIWFLACITFVALSLFEFALSYTFYRNQRVKYLRVNEKHPSMAVKLKWKLTKLTVDQWSRILFPFLFITFVISYISILVSLSNKRRNMLINWYWTSDKVFGT